MDAMSTPPYGLGAVPSTLKKDHAQYRSLAMLAPPPTLLPATTRWQIGGVLDQEQTGTCVGNGGAHWLSCMPIPDLDVDESLAQAVYCEVKAIEAPNTPCDLQAGAEPQTLATVLQGRGRMGVYGWEDGNPDSLRDFLLGQSPVIFACVWYQSMFRTDSNGFVVVDPSSGEAGGHCTLLFGYDTQTDAIDLQNSWGATWMGAGCLPGCAKLWRPDLAKLSWWQALASVELPLPLPVPPFPAPAPTPTPPDPAPPGCIPGSGLIKRAGAWLRQRQIQVQN